jgi:drug/metabolite transporter (DMT)-like permease
MSEHRISNRDFAISIGLMLLAGLCLSLVALFAKDLTGSAGLGVAVFIRFFAPFLVLAWIAFVVFDEPMAFGDWRIHVFRSAFALGAQYCLFYYLSQGSLLIGTLLFSTSGLFLPFVTYFAYGLEIKRKTLIAILISFVGVGVVLHPTANFGWAMLIGLMAGLLNAGSQAVMHRASKQVDTLSATFMMFALCSVGALAILTATGGLAALPVLVSPSRTGGTQFLLIVAAFAVFTISNQSLRTKAYRLVNKPASLSPFYYAAIVFSGILDWLVYGVVPAWNVYVGTALILAGGVVMAWRGTIEPTAAQHAA